MTGEVILLTGSTGHIGYATLIEALKKGYNVRAAVRRSSAIDNLKSTQSIQPYISQLTFVEVPDITVPGAFDEHVKDVDYVVHIASPLAGTSTDYENGYITPAVNGTLGILHSALQAPRIKRVVITASMASVLPRDGPVTSFTADTVVADIQAPFANPFAAYTASKIRAHNAVRNLIATQAPHFGIVNIMPAFVIGKNELATMDQVTKSGSNRVLMQQLRGNSGQGPFLPMTVHVDDVAFLHVAALDTANEKIKQPHDNFGASWPQRFNFVDVNGIVKRRFPDLVAKGVLPADGVNLQQDSVPFYDTLRTEEVFGFKFRDLESQVVDLVEHYWQVKAVEQ